jgi:hypothetical protein
MQDINVTNPAILSGQKSNSHDLGKQKRALGELDLFDPKFLFHFGSDPFFGFLSGFDQVDFPREITDGCLTSAPMGQIV